MADTMHFEFPGFSALAGVRTSILLDVRGAKVTVVGVTPCTCGCHDAKLMVRFVVKGKSNEDPGRLALVERMIRGFNPVSHPDACAAALELTQDIVSKHVKDTCKGAVHG